jgi:hypothetical protein
MAEVLQREAANDVVRADPRTNEAAWRCDMPPMVALTGVECLRRSTEQEFTKENKLRQAPALNLLLPWPTSLSKRFGLGRRAHLLLPASVETLERQPAATVHGDVT